MGGEGLADFERSVREKLEGGIETGQTPRMEPLFDLLGRLLADQPNWAVFCERNCDQIDHTFRVSMKQLFQRLEQAYQGQAPSSEGFCAINQSEIIREPKPKIQNPKSKIRGTPLPHHHSGTCSTPEGPTPNAYTLRTVDDSLRALRSLESY